MLKLTFDLTDSNDIAATRAVMNLVEQLHQQRAAQMAAAQPQAPQPQAPPPQAPQPPAPQMPQGVPGAPPQAPPPQAPPPQAPPPQAPPPAAPVPPPAATPGGNGLDVPSMHERIRDLHSRLGQRGAEVTQGLLQSYGVTNLSALSVDQLQGMITSMETALAQEGS